MKSKKILLYFFYACLIIILIQIFIGGITRLTGSGLSMTEWKVIAGTIPPLNEVDWMESFDKYKTIPQYEIVNPNMTLQEYKYIFFWEYFHRMWGRFGFLFIFLGSAFLWLKNYLSPKWTKRMFWLLVIYAMQGVLGWFMVYSGLSDLIYVSHYRLTAHLLFAIVIFAYIAWLISLLIEVKKIDLTVSNLKPLFWIILIVFIFQLSFGGFMSGLRLSIHYPTWPLMQGKLIPDNLFFMKPIYKNFGENYATIQFVHRNLAYLLFFLIMFFWYKIKNIDLGKTFKTSINFLPLLLCFQIILGIATLLLSKKGIIPISLASAHQINGLLLFTNFVFVWFLLKNSEQSIEG